MSKLSNSVLETIKTPTTKKAVKKVVTRKPLTEAQKEMQAKKRALNPTYSNAVSQAFKTDNNAKKQDFKRMLLEAKKRSDLLNDANLDSLENLVFINLCKSYINKLLRKGNEAQIETFKKSNKLNRFGGYQINWICSNIAKEVKKIL